MGALGNHYLKDGDVVPLLVASMDCTPREDVQLSQALAELGSSSPSVWAQVGTTPSWAGLPSISDHSLQPQIAHYYVPLVLQDSVYQLTDTPYCACIELRYAPAPLATFCSGGKMELLSICHLRKMVISVMNSSVNTHVMGNADLAYQAWG